MSPRRCNTVRSTPRLAEYEIIDLILGKYYTIYQAMPSEVPVDRTRGHGTTSLRVKENIEDVSSELDKRRAALLGRNVQNSISPGDLGSNKTSSKDL
ncbi:hypothetical protein TNCV_4700301 [Trichonephila clavipes]|nr:hypothetical protein TNCV_4700301 [Trichonephila clavipes]